MSHHAAVAATPASGETRAPSGPHDGERRPADNEAASQNSTTTTALILGSIDQFRAEAWAAIEAARGRFSIPFAGCAECRRGENVAGRRYCRACFRAHRDGLDRRRQAELRMPPLDLWRAS